jgi:hypothetical protein
VTTIKHIALQLQKLVCRQNVLVIGDSHTGVFRGAAIRAHFPLTAFKVVSVVGATASGLQNPNSKTQALPTFMDCIERTPEAQKVIILLGEVDAGFVIWYRAQKYGTSVEEMLEKALFSYQEFLLKFSDQRQLICMSAPLPTIKDGQAWGKVANLRKAVKATQEARTQLTLKFNQRMKAFCQEHEIEYLDFDQASLGADGIVEHRLLNKHPTDHHYDYDAYRKMILPALKKCLR